MKEPATKFDIFIVMALMIALFYFADEDSNSDRDEILNHVKPLEHKIDSLHYYYKFNHLHHYGKHDSFGNGNDFEGDN